MSLSPLTTQRIDLEKSQQVNRNQRQVLHKIYISKFFGI